MTRSTDDPAIKKSVSFPTSLLRMGLTRARSLGWNLSQYCQHLMRQDILARTGDPVTRIAEHTPAYKTKAQLEHAAKAFTKTKKRQAKRKSAA